MSQRAVLASKPALLSSLGAAGLVVAAAGATCAWSCEPAPPASEWLHAGWSLIGPWLGTTLSLLVGRDARPPLSWLPALTLLGSLCTLLLLPVLHDGLLACALCSYAMLLGSTVYGRYLLRLASNLACCASLAALHAFAALCPVM